MDTYINEKRDSKIFYMLPRVHELHRGAARRISLIYVSRSLDWMRELDPATLDTLGRTAAVQLSKYGLAEVRDIIDYRSHEAFQSGAVSYEIIDFIANVSMSYGGVRYALELLLGAGSIAEMDLADSVKADM